MYYYYRYNIIYKSNLKNKQQSGNTEILSKPDYRIFTTTENRRCKNSKINTTLALFLESKKSYYTVDLQHPVVVV